MLCSGSRVINSIFLTKAHYKYRISSSTHKILPILDHHKPETACVSTTQLPCKPAFSSENRVNDLHEMLHVNLVRFKACPHVYDMDYNHNP